MKQKPQVDKEHYRFSSYYSLGRWASLWHQLEEMHQLGPDRVLEVGPGKGLFKLAAGSFGLAVDTVDVAADLQPDYLAPATALPCDDDSYDCVCAFQVLEHLPYEESLRAFREMLRVTKRWIVISLPDYRPVWQYRIHIPGVGAIEKQFHKPFWRPSVHPFNGEHYWVVNAKGYGLSKIIHDLTQGEVALQRTYRVDAFPVHRFFVFRKTT